ncbi:hypothetical protein A6R68_12303 [Neotoma lepida]|uniref:Uncharacterized protein n=1 Tax=Neotoma lepida TaxID=56216 RepID=A0A1A6H425_NEOLE|nr:hypothetical protein A6R68_12303 [Neotoma lepida]
MKLRRSYLKWLRSLNRMGRDVKEKGRAIRILICLLSENLTLFKIFKVSTGRLQPNCFSGSHFSSAQNSGPDAEHHP